MKLTTTCASLLIAQTIAASYVCSNTTVTETGLVPKADFMFLIDASGSMCEKIKGVVSGLKKFANKIQSSKIDAQYGLVVFGGRAELKLQFTNNHGKLISNLEKVGCSRGGQEASFEAMRILFNNNGADLVKNCDKTVDSSCGVFWRANATKVIMHATDEDSDLPVLASYRVTNQTQASSFCARFYKSDNADCRQGNGDRYEPPFEPSGLTNRIVIDKGKFFQQSTIRNMYRTGNGMKLSSGYENEIQQTANVLIQNGVILNSLVGLTVGTEEQAEKEMLGLLNPLSSFTASGNYYFAATNDAKNPYQEDMLTTATYQFGHPGIQIQDPQTFSNFDSKKTLQKLNQLGMTNSLQARMLRADGFMRVFDIDAFAGDKNTKVIDAFYEQMLQTTSYVQQNCVFIPDPVTSTTTSSSSTRSTTSSSTSSTTSSPSTSTTSTTSSTTSSSTSSSVSTVPSTTESSTSSEIVSSSSSSEVVSSSSSLSVSESPSSSSVSESSSSSFEETTTTIADPTTTVGLQVTTTSFAELTTTDAQLPTTTTEEITTDEPLPTLVPVVSVTVVQPPVVTSAPEDEVDSNPPVDAYPPSMNNLIVPFLPKARGGSADKVDIVSKSSTSSQPKVTLVVVDGPQADGAQTSSPASPSSTAAIAILAPAAAIASAFGLFMLRKSRAVARDIKFAFGTDSTSAGQNPLYASQFQAHENPLFSGSNEVNLASNGNINV